LYLEFEDKIMIFLVTKKRNWRQFLFL